MPVSSALSLDPAYIRGASLGSCLVLCLCVPQPFPAVAIDRRRRLHILCVLESQRPDILHAQGRQRRPRRSHRPSRIHIRARTCA